MYWTIALTVLVVATIWLRWRYKNRRMLEMAKQFPGPKPLPLLGNAVSFMCRPEHLAKVIKELIHDFGEVFVFWLGPDLNVVVTNPEDLKIILSNNKASVKGPQYKYMADVLGGGILSGSGVMWRKHRKIATPNYAKRAIESYNNIFNTEVDLLLGKLREIPTGKEFDIHRTIVRTTSYSVCQTLMGLTKEQTMNLPHIEEIIDQTHRMYDIVFSRMTKWYLQIDPIFRMTKLYKWQSNYIKLITKFSEVVVQHSNEKLATLKDEWKRDLMDPENDEVNENLSVIHRFILSREFTHDELIKETFTIFTSSQEASAKISSFLLLMLAYHPKCQEKLYEEIKTVTGDKDVWLSDEHLKQMPYLELVFKEVVRLFPIGVMLQRTINEDIEISTGTLPAGCALVVPIYHLHRDSRFWNKPEEFDPERFNSENSKNRHSSCYIPFSLGPMDCLGRNFGTKLIKTICVRVLREFKVTSLQSYEDLRISIAISATPLDGFKLMLHPRQRKTI